MGFSGALKETKQFLEVVVFMIAAFIFCIFAWVILRIARRKGEEQNEYE